MWCEGQEWIDWLTCTNEKPQRPANNEEVVQGLTLTCSSELDDKCWEVEYWTNKIISSLVAEWAIEEIDKMLDSPKYFEKMRQKHRELSDLDVTDLFILKWKFQDIIAWNKVAEEVVVSTLSTLMIWWITWTWIDKTNFIFDLLGKIRF